MSKARDAIIARKSLDEQYDPTNLETYVPRIAKLNAEHRENQTPAEEADEARRALKFFESHILPHLPKPN